MVIPGSHRSIRFNSHLSSHLETLAAILTRRTTRFARRRLRLYSHASHPRKLTTHKSLGSLAMTKRESRDDPLLLLNPSRARARSRDNEAIAIYLAYTYNVQSRSQPSTHVRTLTHTCGPPSLYRRRGGATFHKAPRRHHTN